MTKNNISKKFVGFGFGPIQAGLMVYEAQASGNFDSFIIAEVDQKLVDAVRKNKNRVFINIGNEQGIVSKELVDIRLLNPREKSDQEELAKAIFNADEIATAIPSIDFYNAGGPASIAALLAANLNPDKSQLVYASENNNFAAEKLHEAVQMHKPQLNQNRFQIVNTVIGKMSGVKQSKEDIEQLGLSPIVPGWDRAILVESFNRILISRVTLPDFKKGITFFEEKDDLLPFEEAKLFGHNAIHSLLGYLAQEKKYQTMSRIRNDEALMELGRQAFLQECGAALIKKHGALGDPLFTEEGFAAYADDLLMRMTNPFLHDEVTRIIRDPARKLGYHDRFFGTMQLALHQNITPKVLAKGAAAALRYLAQQEGKNTLDEQIAREILEKLWGHEKTDQTKESLLALVAQALNEP